MPPYGPGRRTCWGAMVKGDAIGVSWQSCAIDSRKLSASDCEISMKLHQFRHAVAIAEQGSLRGAARRLGVAQPTLTRGLLQLEHELGAPLFERRAKGMVATPLGQAF